MDNTWNGYVTSHDIWEFYNYNTNFNIKEIFNLPDGMLIIHIYLVLIVT